MDSNASIRFELSNATPKQAAFLRLLAQAKGLSAHDDKFPTATGVAAIFRGLQVEGVFPITQYLERTLPGSTIYTPDIARNAVLDTLSYLILTDKAPVDIAKGCYVAITEPRFVCHSDSPTILDLTVAAVFITDETASMPWAQPMLKRLEEWRRNNVQRLREELLEGWTNFKEPELQYA